MNFELKNSHVRVIDRNTVSVEVNFGFRTVYGWAGNELHRLISGANSELKAHQRIQNFQFRDQYHGVSEIYGMGPILKSVSRDDNNFELQDGSTGIYQAVEFGPSLKELQNV